MATNRSNSMHEVATELQTAITSKWAASLTECNTDWSTPDTLGTPVKADIRIGHVPVWSGSLSLSIIGVGNQDDLAFLGKARIRTWSFDIALFFPASGNDEATSRQTDHYLQLLWMSLRDYNYCTNGIIIDIAEQSRYSEIRDRSPYIDPGVVGGILQITTTSQYLV